MGDQACCRCVVWCVAPVNALSSCCRFAQLSVAARRAVGSFCQLLPGTERLALAFAHVFFVCCLELWSITDPLPNVGDLYAAHCTHLLAPLSLGAKVELVFTWTAVSSLDCPPGFCG